MQKNNIVKYFISVLLFTSCTENTHISFFCEKGKKDNYIIKWEVFPEKKDNVKIDIFSSDNDSMFSKTPILTTPVNDYISIIHPNKDIFREYFKLRVDNSYSGIITNRFFNNKDIQNLRDVGGYYTRTGAQMKWGKLYRSGDLADASPEDVSILESLHIKTVIDFRSKTQIKMYPDKVLKNVNYIDIPIEINCFNTDIKHRILEGSFLKGDAIIYTQDCYRNIVEEYGEQYAKMFDMLCNESNYPLLIHCGWGKDRTGIAAYLILKALDISPEFIEEDFLYSNKGINKEIVLEGAENLSESIQEAITMMSTCDISQLKYAISCMKKKSGSVDEYMHKELKLSPKKIAQLKEILLYN